MATVPVRSRIPGRSVGPAPDVPQSLLAERRRKLLDLIGDSAIAVIPSGPELLKSRDTEIVFRQASDLYYLTGFPEPQSLAVLSSRDGAPHLTLFVRPRAPEQEAWTGPRIGIEGAGEEYAADVVYPIDELSTRLPQLLRAAETIHYPVGMADPLDRLVTESIRSTRIRRPRTGQGPTTVVDLEVATGELRLIKDKHELDCLRVAAQIAAAGHVAAMLTIRPGVGEWEIQAELESAFRGLGAAVPAYPSIVGSGPNATTLHYVDNRSRVRDGDLVLIDAGAEWGMYCSDITRTTPASGKFTPEQRDVYEVVMAAEQAAIDSVRPGVTISEVHETAVRELIRGMMDLGILPTADADSIMEAGDYKRFYLHQTSHWIGLDVHDVGPYRRGGQSIKLEPGMVLTIEPGIYIPVTARDVPAALLGTGIRIEDDVIVTEAGHEIITRDVPVDPDEIEALMAGE